MKCIFYNFYVIVIVCLPLRNASPGKAIAGKRSIQSTEFNPCTNTVTHSVTHSLTRSLAQSIHSQNKKVLLGHKMLQ